MKSTKNRDRNITHFLYVLPNLIMYSFLSIVPIVLGLYYSFTNWNGISDGAGFVIRNHIKSAIPGKYLKHAYIPDIPGKERRKSAPGREGKLGVEGMTPEVILAALRNAGATIEGEETTSSGGITKQDLMALGLSGGSNAGEKRKALLKKLNLPEHMSANAMLQALNLLYTREELEQMLNESGIECD